MASNFTHSRVVIRQLAQAISRTPPSEEDSELTCVDRSLGVLGRTFDSHGERLRQGFVVQQEFIATQIKDVEKKMDGRFQEVDGRFQEIEKKMDGRFQEVDGRFQEIEKKMDGRFQEMEKKMDRRFEEVEDRARAHFEQTQNILRNGLLTKGWEPISPVGSLGPRGGVHFPENFPRTIMQFWKLKKPPQMDRLVRLIRFYNILGYEDWSRDSDSLEGYSGSDDSSQESSQSLRLPMSLEEAVRSNPETAHRVLGGKLGLAYNKIQKFMDRAKELSQARAMSQKRRQDEQQVSEDRNKRGFKISSQGTDVTSPTEPRSSQERPE